MGESLTMINLDLVSEDTIIRFRKVEHLIKQGQSIKEAFKSVPLTLSHYYKLRQSFIKKVKNEIKGF